MIGHALHKIAYRPFVQSLKLRQRRAEKIGIEVSRTSHQFQRAEAALIILRPVNRAVSFLA